MDVKMIKAITAHTQYRTFDKYLKIEDEKKKTEINKAWGKVQDPGDPEDEFKKKTEEALKSIQGDKQKLIDYLNILEDPEPGKQTVWIGFYPENI